ncbi:MAG TPA: DUF5777 family beta-barrel protein [Thermoanaerobaculia bacterium]|nr:DUF5777 family beta-barrel protein [Thermoanaerobaculia bacterium]
MGHPGRRAAAAVAAAAVFLLAPSAAAQEGVKDVATDVGNRFINTATPLTNDKGVGEAVITHRFDASVIDSGGSSLWGLDGSAQIGLGIEYVPLQNVAVQVYRARSYADYEFAAKVTLLWPKKGLPLGIGVRGGLNWLSATYLPSLGLEKQSSGFGQLLVSYTIADRVTLAAAPTYVQRTPVQTDVWNVPVIAQIRITKSIALMGEFIPKSKADLREFDPASGTYVSVPPVPQWAVLLEKAVYHHRFGLYIGNTVASTVDQMMGGDYGAVPATDRNGNPIIVGGVTDKNIHFGFNIVRSFDFPPR